MGLGLMGLICTKKKRGMFLWVKLIPEGIWRAEGISFIFKSRVVTGSKGTSP